MISRSCPHGGLWATCVPCAATDLWTDGEAGLTVASPSHIPPSRTPSISAHRGPAQVGAHRVYARHPRWPRGHEARAEYTTCRTHLQRGSLGEEVRDQERARVEAVHAEAHDDGALGAELGDEEVGEEQRRQRVPEDATEI